MADFCINFFVVFPPHLAVLFLLPGWVAFRLSHSPSVVFAVVALIYLAFVLFAVWSVTLTDEGIRFERLLGGPRFLPWSKITSVEVAPRWELICKGWLWPLFPAREMTPSLSSVRHYRITWAGGFCYYPPADAEAFERCVSSRLPKLPG